MKSSLLPITAPKHNTKPSNSFSCIICLVLYKAAEPSYLFVVVASYRSSFSSFFPFSFYFEVYIHRFFTHKK